MDLPTSSLQRSISIMDTWVESYPHQHMHMPVNMAMSLAPAAPSRRSSGTMPRDAPAESRVVMGTDFSSKDATLSPWCQSE